MKKNIIQEKSFNFSLKIINLCKILNINKEFIISKQLLRSGTSVGSNIVEALAGESRKDFIHKMSSASKEARETEYWLMLLEKSQAIKYNYYGYLREIESIVNLLTKIVKTTSKTT